MKDDLIGKIITDSFASSDYKGIVICADPMGAKIGVVDSYLTYVPDEKYQDSHGGNHYLPEEIKIIDEILKKYCKTTYEEARKNRRFWYVMKLNITVVGSVKTYKRSNRW